MNRSRYRINIKKIMGNIVFLLLVFILFNIFTSQIFGLKDIKTKEFTIKSGDTLWNISSNICEKDSSLNIQDVIYDIKEINNLDNTNIIEGATILVPIYN